MQTIDLSLKNAQEILTQTFPAFQGGFEPMPQDLPGCLRAACDYVDRWAGGRYFGEAVRARADIKALFPM